MSTSDETALVRVARGTASQEEIAALTAVLLARAVAGGHDDPHPDGPSSAVARWSRPERRPWYRSPVSWRGAS
ncbi:acyl-CoA carboxylase subunit epsilon [Streptomyces alanosinicus]|uniref:Acyl-CoA carboxylase subunit epsilon n=1 Tax=Streptomyces alanosinicus TaxID=68171 RepID=A0A918YS04_9ACTN|nr:acyl-CoA carboxylase subunit epsilon [Streptomyces alanosinicus]GHE13895.1 hypothetical protein GCM10010339_82670 [Streptomyces alanosinicus]